MIGELEDKVVQWLGAYLPDRIVQAYPDSPEGYDWGRGAKKGLVLVRYQGSDYRQARDTSVGHQDREIEFAVTIIAHSLRGHAGIYPILEAARDALAGWRPMGGSGFKPVTEGFVAMKANVWRYELTVTTTLPYVPPVQPEPPLADSFQAIFDNQDGEVLGRMPREEP